jgi:hypothetical protein
MERTACWVDAVAFRESHHEVGEAWDNHPQTIWKVLCPPLWKEQWSLIKERTFFWGKLEAKNDLQATLKSQLTYIYATLVVKRWQSRSSELIIWNGDRSGSPSFLLLPMQTCKHHFISYVRKVEKWYLSLMLTICHWNNTYEASRLYPWCHRLLLY